MEVRTLIPYDVKQNWSRYGMKSSEFNYEENDGAPPWLPTEAEVLANYSSAGKAAEKQRSLGSDRQNNSLP